MNEISLPLETALLIVTYREGLDLRIDYSRRKSKYGINISCNDNGEFTTIINTPYEIDTQKEAVVLLLEYLETAINIVEIECLSQSSIPYTNSGFLSKEDYEQIREAFTENSYEVLTADILQT